MISLTRLNSQQLTLNCDLIETIEANPDTVIALTTGQKIIVRETANEVVARVRRFKKSLVRKPSLRVSPESDPICRKP
jgi:flagellar protein FlbD